MIVLDTNVLSEEMRPTPEPAVHGWLTRQNPMNLFTTAVTEAEILYGVAIKPDGRRNDASRRRRDVSWICSPGASCRSTARRRASSPGS